MEKKGKDSSAAITKIVLVVITLVAIVGAFIGYRHFDSERGRLEEVNIEREDYRDELEAMELQRGTIEAETATMNAQIEQYMGVFPRMLTHARAIQNLHDMVQASEVEITHVAPTFDEVFYEPTPPTPAPTEEAAGEVDADATPAPIATPVPIILPKDDVTNVEGAEPNYGMMVGTKTSMQVQFIASYDQFREAIKFVVSNANRMSLEDVSAAFESETGRLAVDMRIGMYELKYGRAPFVEPVITGVDLIKDPLFSTGEGNENPE